MNRMLPGLLAATFGLAISCGGDSPKGGFTLNLTQFQPHANQKLYLKVKDATGASTLGEATGIVPDTGILTLQIAGVFENGKSYRADLYADTNNNGTYDPPTGTPPNLQFAEHSWRFSITGNAAGVTRDFPHDEVWSDISPF